MIAGLMRAREIAQRWAATARHQAGDRGQSALEAAAGLMSREDIVALRSWLQAELYEQLAAAIQRELDGEKTPTVPVDPAAGEAP